MLSAAVTWMVIYDARQLLAAQRAAKTTRAQRDVKPRRVGGSVNFTSDGGGMCSKIYVPTIAEFLSGSDKIKQLELENAALESEVETLKFELQKMKDEIAAKELADAQARAKKRKVKSQIIKLKAEGFQYKEIAEKTGYSYHYILKACAERGLTNAAMRNNRPSANL